MSNLEADVVVIGAGPVGALMGNLLGQLGLRAAIFEQERSPHGIPRAFSCDDEALRIYQNAGLIEQIRAAMRPADVADFADAEGRSFAKIVFEGLDFGHGFPALSFFHQPALEAILRGGLSRFAEVSLHLGKEVTALRQREDRVELTVKDTASGEESTVSARYALGCDGRKSAARKLAGIDYTGARYEEAWIAISGEVERFPEGRPPAQFVCDPWRPGFVACGAENRMRLEFMLRPGETKESIERPESVAALIAPYIDPAKIRVERASLYKFEAKTAAAWRKGRLLLLGDAAHTMPPFMGQGLVSGLRDAFNLAWKLAFVLEGRAPDTLLDSYEAERRPHTRAMIGISRAIGKVFLVRDPLLARLRDALFRALDRVPRARRFIQNAEFKPAAMFDRGAFSGGARRKGRFDGAPGVPPAFPEGTWFPQPRVATPAREAVLLDDVLGPGFAVLGRDLDPRSVARDAALWARLKARFFRVLPPGATAESASEIVDSTGALGRWLDRYEASLAVLRPDRVVFGAQSAAAFGALEDELAAMLRPEPRQ